MTDDSRLPACPVVELSAAYVECKRLISLRAIGVEEDDLHEAVLEVLSSPPPGLLTPSYLLMRARSRSIDRWRKRRREAWIADSAAVERVNERKNDPERIAISKDLLNAAMELLKSGHRKTLECLLHASGDMEKARSKLQLTPTAMRKRIERLRKSARSVVGDIS